MSGKTNFVAGLFGGVVLALSTVGQADAALIQSTIGGVPTAGVTYANFDALPLGSAGGIDSGITVSFNPDGQTVVGTVSGQYAAPFLSGGNGTLFGNPANGADTTRYLSTGVGGVNLLFPTDQTYVGLLWGSVDNYNTLQFYQGATLLASYTGLDVTALANGDQGASGTFYVNIFLDAAFNRIVASSSQYAFEFDNVAYGQLSLVPEPATLALFGTGLLVFGAMRRRRRSKTGDRS
jgi:hypothetical protein